MNSTNHAAKTTSISVVNRKRLWKGGAISIMVPNDAREGKFPSPNGGGRYFGFTRGVKRGVVNFFIHSDNPGEFCGKGIVAGAEIWQKTLIDGREFLYVNLRPSARAKPTHRLVVMAKEKRDLMVDSPSIIFETPPPLTGVIIVAPIGSKILTKDAKTPPAAESVRPTNVIDIHQSAASPATSAMLKEFAGKWNGHK